MRPIDADKLLARYKERCAECKFTPNHCEHFCDIADVISDIEDAPTIEERKKAEWIDVRDYCGEFMCSNCKETNINNSYKYCPYCGADMRGKQDATIR